MSDNDRSTYMFTKEDILLNTLSTQRWRRMKGLKYIGFVYLLVLVCGLMGVSISSIAANIDHVNVGRIAVEDQSLRSQQRAGKMALAQVFIKLSGNPSVIREPEISKAIDNYEQFLISSSFIQQQQTLVFEATFNQGKIESLLLASGLSVWASLRPSAVVWIALEDSAQQKRLLSQYGSNALSLKIGLKAFARGVEVISPLGDLQDAMNVSVYDVWNQFISKLQEQSMRYNADYLISATAQPYNAQDAAVDRTANDAFFTQSTNVTGELSSEQNEPDVSHGMRSEEGVNTLSSGHNSASLYETKEPDEVDLTAVNVIGLGSVKPQLLLANIPVPEGTTHKLDYVITQVDATKSKKVETGRVFGTSEDDVVIKLIDVYANMLAKEFALSSQSELNGQVITVSISGIDSLEDYVNMIALVRTIPSVTNVRLIKQVNDTALIDIEQRISVTQLKSILSLDNRLTSNANASDASISFSWQGQ